MKIYAGLCKDFVSWDKLTISQFRVTLLPLLEGNLAKTTIYGYDYVLRKLVEIAGDKLLQSVNPYDIEVFKSARLGEVSPTRVNLEYRTLRAAFHRAVKLRMIASSPFTSTSNITIPEKEPLFLSKEEFEAILCTIDKPQIRSIVTLAVCTTMRLGELVNLEWENVDLAKEAIHLRSKEGFVLKGKKNRSIPLNRIAMNVVSTTPRTSRYLFAGNTGSRLSGPWVSRQFKRYARKAGLSEDVHFHSLRHTGASWLVQQGVPLPFVQQILGHTSISTTMIYAHSSVHHLRESVKAIDKLLMTVPPLRLIPLTSTDRRVQ